LRVFLALSFSHPAGSPYDPRTSLIHHPQALAGLAPYQQAGHDAVWIRLPPTDELVEEEWVGIASKGTVVWVYASGCAAAHRPQKTASDTKITVLQGDCKDIPQS